MTKLSKNIIDDMELIIHNKNKIKDKLNNKKINVEFYILINNLLVNKEYDKFNNLDNILNNYTKFKAYNNIVKNKTTALKIETMNKYYNELLELL
jgi:hypothetical protein